MYKNRFQGKIIIKIKVMKMNFIPCISNCRYQFDGRCELAGTTSIINDCSDRCPFYKKRDDEMLFPDNNFDAISAQQQHQIYH